MSLDKYTIQHKSVSNILSLIDMNKIAIPEIQRPFVWKKTKVRDLMDSLYKGFPVGYIITWQNPDVRLKDGTSAKGKTILIDGQQRITALKAALDGQEVVNSRYESERIMIAFHPIKEQFETSTPAIKRDKAWIADISEVMKPDFDPYSFVEKYIQANPDVDKSTVGRRLKELTDMKTRTIGELEINSEIEIETVNEIFIRINSKGTRLSEADFAMSRIAVFEIDPGDEYGVYLRKYFDYFCNLLQSPKVIDDIEKNDQAFSGTDQFSRIKWVANEQQLIYRPLYSDVIRVAGMIGLNRARMRDVVALLAGRNFEVRSFNQENSYLREIAENSFLKFNDSITAIVNEYNYKRFEQDILRGSGFTSSAMFSSANVLNYAFSIFHKLLQLKADYADVRSMTRRFLVFSILTEHHSGSFETMWDRDFKNFDTIDRAKQLLRNYENEQLSEVFWRETLPRSLDKSATSRTPEWNVYVAAQNMLGLNSFLSDVATRNMQVDDLHHIFPQQFMKENGFSQYQYNRIANFVILSRDINIKIGKTEPADYLSRVSDFGVRINNLNQNLSDNCIPIDTELWELKNYDSFMKQRNQQIAQLIRRYYTNL